jgi:ubiquinone/menaquinone biosynthesis C-methylase UbiE
MLAEEVRVRGSALQWTGVDLRSEAVARAAGLHPWATFLEAPADDLPFKQSAFDVVVCSVLFSSLPSRSMERNVAQEITRVLRPGGWLVWYDLRYSNPANPEVHAVTQRRLAELFNGWHSELRLLTLLPPVTRRLGRLTAIAYPALHLFPPLRSHLLGRLQRPT